ncbi:MAG: hypothetical protein CL927_18650 [Deltaproteobacteria bacterium]|nr:hypothetical protein [Deltaproteobacteria bacterium]
MRAWWTTGLALVVGFGCGGKALTPIDGESFASTPEDSGAPTDSATPDPPSDGPGVDLAVQLVGAVPNMGLNLHTVVLGLEPDAPLEIADATIAGATATVAVDAADARWWTDFDDGSRGFAALPFVYVDDDQNGVHTPEEQYIGFGTEGALFIDGVPGSTLAAAGFSAGWNAFAADLVSGELVPHAAGLAGLTLQPQLIPQDRPVVEAQFEGDPRGLRVAMVPETVLDGVVDGPLIFDQPVTSTVQIAIDGPPPDSHLQDWGADGTQYRDWRYSVEFLVLYEDTDASGDFAMTDTIIGMGCVDGLLARWQHCTEPDRAFEALYLATHEIIPAWSVWLDRAEGAEYLRIDDSPPILLSDACLP